MEHKIIHRDINSLIFAEYNPRQLTKDQYQNLKDSISRFGLVDPIIVNKNKERKNIIIGGHQRVKVAKDMDIEFVPVLEVDLTYEKERELNIRLNKNTGEWDMDNLANFFDMDELIDWGFDGSELVFEEQEDIFEEARVSLAERFVVPPFSVLDSRQGYWRDRKKSWHSIINDKGQSREGALVDEDSLMASIHSFSLLDPVIAELSNLWFGIDGGNTFDCFAGDSVFGYVSSYLGNQFTGIELRQEQADLNNKRISEYTGSRYVCDDGQNVLKHIEKKSQDLLFSCPPYYDLEVYSDLDNDASNQQEYEDFLNILNKAFTDSIKCLKENRFAVIVVGEIRDKKGFYRNFTGDIKNIFIKNKMQIYNEMIFVESLGTLPQRVNRYMKNRKVGKCHQNILVFYKGDVSQISNNYKEIKFDSTDLEL